LTAIHAGDGAAAFTGLDRVHSTEDFPDLQVRRAQALVLAGKPKEARALAKPAAGPIRSRHRHQSVTHLVVACERLELLVGPGTDSEQADLHSGEG